MSHYLPYTLFLFIGNEVEILKEKALQLHHRYIDITTSAAKSMKSHVAVQKLRFAVLCLPPHLKKEHEIFIKKARADIKVAESSEDIFYVVGEHCDYLNYSLLHYLVDLYGNDELKKEMADYVQLLTTFRRETRLEIFLSAYEEKPEKDDDTFSTMVTKHQMDWATATLEDVEIFRRDICREVSLYEFSLNLIKVAHGCVEITWLIPQSLLAYIQMSIKPNSPSLMKHHVLTLNIDGFIVYDSTTGTVH